jgi:DNA-binding MarR family transcriptional regulator
MTYRPESLLDGIETLLADGLRRDADALSRREATARVLLALGRSEGIPMGELSRRTARDPSTVTRFVIRATEDGLVEQRTGTVDRRERLLFLTPSGRAARDALLGARATRTARVRAGVAGRTGLGPDEVDWFLGALHAALVTDGETHDADAAPTPAPVTGFGAAPSTPATAPDSATGAGSAGVTSEG